MAEPPKGKYTYEENKKFFTNLYKALDTMDPEQSAKFMSKDLINKVDQVTIHGLDEWKNQMKQSLGQMPTLERADHVSTRMDVAADGLIWDSGYAILQFKDDPKHEPITISVAAKYIRLPADHPDESERGKLAFQELFHDMKNVGKKIEEIKQLERESGGK